MHLSLKGSLKSSLIFTYVKTDQVLDLGNLEPFTIPDLSGNANTATLYSGIYVTTNGTTDKAIGADATALGSGNYYLTGKIKPAGTTAKTTMNGSTASNLTGLTAGVWQDFQTATASAITPSSINLGWDGTAFNTTVDNWSDVKLHDASDDSVVAQYKLYDSAAASLDGYPALDCVGGFHGAHVGCAGGSGEPDILQTAGEDFNKLPYFNGTDTSINYGSPLLPATGDFDFEFTWYVANASAPATFLYAFSQGTSASNFLGVALTTSGLIAVYHCNGTPVFQSIGTTYFSSLVKIRLQKVSGNLTVHLDDVPQTTVAVTGSISQTNSIWGDTSFLTGNRHALGLIYGDEVTGTQSGAFSLYHVAESETTAGQDALGNAITNPRPNERVLNLTTGTGYAEVADSASLDLTTAGTWELWGNFYELFSSSETLLSKWSSSATAQRSWIVNGNNGAELNRVRLAISANGSSVSWIGYVEVPDSVSSLIFTYNGTIVAGYVNGSSVTVTTTFGSIPASMNVGTAPLFIGTDNDSGTMLLRQIGDIRIYDRVLTADEVLKNYQARKSAYGL
jgi:hypothetical protein